MKVSELKGRMPESLLDVFFKEFSTLTPSQEKAVKAGLLDRRSLLVCTPTASGKTNIGLMAALKSILEQKAKALYIVPLKALANEKFNDFNKRFGHLARVGMSIGDIDSSEPYLGSRDLIICTSEKLDSLLRHHAPWINSVRVMVVDEIHLLNDPSRGPALEVIITLLREIIRDIQIIGLSATIGNPEDVAGWLSAGLVIDRWRPVKLKKGVYFQGRVEFDS